MRWWRNLALTLGPVVLVLVLLRSGSCRERQETRQDVEQKAAIAQADTVYRERVDTQWRVRTTTDVRIQHDTVFTRDTVRAIVQAERTACDAVVSACTTQVALRDLRIKTLEARQRGWLFLYGQGAGLFRPSPPIRMRFEAEGGIEVPLDRTTDLQLGVTTDQEVKVGVRRRLRVF